MTPRYTSRGLLAIVPTALLAGYLDVFGEDPSDTPTPESVWIYGNSQGTGWTPYDSRDN